MVLLVLRHTLAIIISGAGDYSMTLFMVRLGSVACSSYKKLQLGLPNGAEKKKNSTCVLYAVTDIENSWDSSACLCHGQSIYCYSTSGSAAG